MQILGIPKHFKYRKPIKPIYMLRIQKTVYPDATLDFNQIQAYQLLQRTKDFKLFEKYCNSVKMSEEKKKECLADILSKEFLYNN